jgi:ABC-type transport system involved in multi-copper enzyme maturation permease subunit
MSASSAALARVETGRLPGDLARVPAILDGLKEIAVIWSAETLRAIRSARTIVLLGLYTLFSLITLLVIGAVTSVVRGSGMTLPNLGELPPVIVGVFKVNLFFLPVYVALMGFDQISGEVGSHSIRYITLRARLSSLLVGKFLVQTSLLVGLVLVIDLGIFFYAHFSDPTFTLGAMALGLVKVWMATLVFSLAYIALTTLCSSLFRVPGLSLIFNFAVVFTFLLMDLAGWYYKGKSFLENVRYLSPSYYSANLLSPVLSEFSQSGLAYAGFTLLFLGGAYGVLRARDL